MKNIITIALALLSASATAQVSAGQYALQRKNVGAGFSLIPLTPTADNIWTFNGSGGVTSIPRNTFALSGHIHALNDLSDVTITAPALNDVLQWNGSTWVNAVVSGGGDVVGPASSTDNNVPQWDGTTGKLLKDGLGVSQGGNGAADANKLVQFKSDGGIGAATGLLSGPALYGETGALNQPGVQGYSTNGGEGGRFQSVGGDGVSGSSNTGAGIRGTNSGTTNPPLHINNTDATNAAPLGWLHNVDDEGLEVQNDGGLDWTTLTGSQTTATNLPAFGTGTKGVVPASPGGTSDYLRADGSWATPPVGTGTVTSVAASGNNGVSISGSPITTSGTITIGLGAITPTSVSASGTVNGSNLSGTNTGDQTITLTGDVTGSGTGSFAATIANDAVTYAKMQNVSATDRLLGRQSSGAGDVEEITCTAAGRALIAGSDAAAQRLTLGRIIKKITTQTTGVSTSYTDVTDMSFSVSAGTTYSFSFVVLAECSSTSGGVCLTANGPASTFYAARYEGSQTAGGSIIRSDIAAYDSMGTLAEPNSVTAANTPYVFTLKGVIVPSASGTFSLRVKRGGTAGNIAVRAGSMDVIVL